MDTRNVFGWVLPAGEAHLDAYLPTAPVLGGRSVYQFQQIREALLRAPGRKVAVDVGGHVGFWSYYLAREFQHVYAFEPSAPLIECFRRNVTQPNVYLHEVALGEAPGRVGLNFIADHSMMTHVTEGADGAIERARLDDLELEDVSLVKIDVEGYEPYVLRGARETLLRCRPLVVVEQKGWATRFGLPPEESSRILESLGATVVARVVDDLFFRWPSGSA
jgi:FkbM family methyltransferase